MAYANFVADRLDLRSAYRFDSRAQVIAFDEARQVWTLTTARGERFEADHLIMATGPLSLPKPIDILGAESFRGELYRSGKWPHHAVDFSGKRVGLVGTGSSGIQIAPVVAETCQSLSVFQRTPSFTLPMRNRAISDDFAAQLKANMPGLRAVARNTFTGVSGRSRPGRCSASAPRNAMN